MHDAISRLVEIGAPHRWIVTTGMVAFGLGCVYIAPAWPRPARLTLLLAGITSFGVAAFPCTEGCPGNGAFTDLMHSGMAAIHYGALLATPVLLSRSPLSVATTVIAGLALALHVFGPGPNGLMQRIGLTTLDLWLIGTALRSRSTW